MNQAFSIPTTSIVAYEPSALEAFFVYGFEWIDNFHFLRDPESFLGTKAKEYVKIAAKLFTTSSVPNRVA